MDGLLWYCHMPRWSGQEEDAAVAEARAKLAGGKSKAKKDAEAPKPKKGKEARHWDGGKVSKSLMEELDFSKNKPDEADLAAKQAEFLGSGDEEDFEAEAPGLSRALACLSWRSLSRRGGVPLVWV
eukprot:g28728.t1